MIIDQSKYLIFEVDLIHSTIYSMKNKKHSAPEVAHQMKKKMSKTSQFLKPQPLL
jgi:hypothetical protein